MVNSLCMGTGRCADGAESRWGICSGPLFLFAEKAEAIASDRRKGFRGELNQDGKSNGNSRKQRQIMAIFVTGDTHGSHQLGLHSVDGFMHRLRTEAFPEQKEMSKEDFVVICGDFGGVWSTNRKKVQENAEERHALDWLEHKPFTTLFVPGNHENYDRLTGCRDERLLNSWLYESMPPEEKEKLRQGYPRKEWHGGHVRVIRPSVLMLERGEIFEIDGKSCFAFGGARSHDIMDGILNPADYPDEQSFRKVYAQRRGGMIRVSGVSWWAQEMPTEEEMEYGRQNIRAFMETHDRIDLIFTHDAPSSHRIYLGYPDTDELNRYLESLRDEMEYGKWFYGHLHDNRMVFENNILLYEQIIRVN